MVEKKTSVLYGAAAMNGGILAGATKEEAQALWNFGTYTGIGFQIFDDALNLTTSWDVPGKVRESGGRVMGIGRCMRRQHLILVWLVKRC